MRPSGSPEELERRRLRALSLLDEGLLPSEVACRVGVDRLSVRRWKAARELRIGRMTLWRKMRFYNIPLRRPRRKYCKATDEAKTTMYRAGVVFLLISLVAGLVPVTLYAEKAEIHGVGQYTVPSWFKSSFLNLKEDAAEAGAHGKRLLVYFGQDGCPYCAALFNSNFSQKHITDYTRHHFDAIAINIWGDRPVTDFSGEVLTEKKLATKYKVMFTPTILFFDVNGRQIMRINGYYPPPQFLAALQYVAERRETVEPFAAYLAKVAPKSADGKLHTQPFFEKPPYDLRASTSHKPIAVFFEQKDCTGCDELHRTVLKQPATLEQIRRFRTIQLDRWSDTPVVTPAGERLTAHEWADRLNVAYVPTVVFFDRGKEVIRIEAVLKGFHTQSVMDYVASGAYKQQPNFQRFIQSRADRMRKQGIAVDLWQ